MKALISAAVIALVMTSTANAQQDSTKPRMQHRPPMGIKGRDGKELKDFKHDGGPEKFADRKGRFEHGKEHFAQHLQLTEEQRKQGKTIRENASKQIESLYNNDKLTLGEFKKKKAAILKNKKRNWMACLLLNKRQKLLRAKKE